MCFTVPTPCVSEEDEGDEENEGEIKKNRKSSTLNDLEDWWIIEHAQQVSKWNASSSHHMHTHTHTHTHTHLFLLFPGLG